MTGPSSACVAIARPYGACVRRFSGDLADGAHVGGTPGQRFRTLADTTASKWQVQQDTANAVRVYALAGFKSPSLRPLTRASAEILDPGGSPGSASFGPMGAHHVRNRWQRGLSAFRPGVLGSWLVPRASGPLVIAG